MDCVGANLNGTWNFGCSLSQMGGWSGGFFDAFGQPASTLLFLILIVGFVVLVFIAGKTAIQR